MKTNDHTIHASRPSSTDSLASTPTFARCFKQKWHTDHLLKRDRGRISRTMVRHLLTQKQRPQHPVDWRKNTLSVHWATATTTIFPTLSHQTGTSHNRTLQVPSPTPPRQCPKTSLTPHGKAATPSRHTLHAAYTALILPLARSNFEKWTTSTRPSMTSITPWWSSSPQDLHFAIHYSAISTAPP